MKKLAFILLLLCPIANALAISGVLKQSTAVNVTVVMIDSTDHVTGKTGLTLTIKSSKAAAAFATITPTVTELEGGIYKIAFTTSHTDTLGELRLRVTSTGADESDPIWQVVALLPGDAVTVGTNNDKTGYSLTVTPPTAATIATTIWQDLTASSDFTTSSSIGKLLVDDVNATISSRMATYTQPTGFLAATFPSGTIANTTNITAGTITTTTNLTNLPSIPANWITATGITAGALNGKGDWLLASSYVDIWNVTLPSTYTSQKAGALLWKIGNKP